MPFFRPVLFLALAVVSPLVQAGTYSTIYSFGDSLSDVGNAQALAGIPQAPYYNGRFSNGPIWVDDVSNALGLGPVTASVAGGHDYAVGGAESGATPLHTDSGFDLTDQIALFHLQHATADPNALYTLWIGGNDIRDLLGSNPTQTQVTNDIAAVVSNIDKALGLLGSYGAKNILLVTVPDLGKTPEAIAQGAAAEAGASLISGAFDQSLVSTLPAVQASAGLNLNVLDTYSLIDGLVANPGKFGFTDVTDSCLTNITIPYASGTPCANPNQYLFWDTIHPTTVGQALVGAVALQTVVPEPASVSLFAGVGAYLVWRRTRRAKQIC